MKKFLSLVLALVLTMSLVVVPANAGGVAVTGVTLSAPPETLFVGGEPVTLTATVAPENATNKTVTWASDDVTVASVDQNGNVTAVAAGTANITVTTQDGNKTATCTVKVSDKYVLTVTPATSTVQAVVGYTKTVALTIDKTKMPDGCTYDYTVSGGDSNFVSATAGNGIVTIYGVAATSAPQALTYTVTAKKDSEEVKSATATINVTVLSDSFAITDSNSATQTMSVGGSSVVLNPKLKYSDATEKKPDTWSTVSSNESVVKVDSSDKKTITAVGKGTATVTVTMTFGGKTVTKTYSFTVKALAMSNDVTSGGDYSMSASSVRSAAETAVYDDFSQSDTASTVTVKLRSGGSYGTLYAGDDATDSAVGSSDVAIQDTGIYFKAAKNAIGKVVYDVSVNGTYKGSWTFDVESAGKVDEDVYAYLTSNGSTVSFSLPSGYDKLYYKQGSVSNYDGLWTSEPSGWSTCTSSSNGTLSLSSFNSTGKVTLAAVGIDGDAAYTGTITVYLENYDIEYSGVAGETITFDQGDFEDFMEEAAEDYGWINTSKSSTAHVEFNHVIFSIPYEKTQGILYNDGEQIKSSSKSSVKECTNLDKVTFAIADKSGLKEVVINFTLHADYYSSERVTNPATKTFSGRVVVNVVHEDIKYTVPVDGSVVFKAEDFQDFFDDTYKTGTLSYVKFTELPKVTDGMLYATYSAIYAGTVAEESDKFYYDSSKISDYDLDDVTFRTSLWSKAGTKVYIPFTAYGTKSTQSVDGWVAITVENARTMNFTDVKTGDWFYNNVKNAYSMGLIEGKTTTTFNPDDNMTYAEAVTLAARMNQLYYSGKVTLSNSTTGNWYSSYESYAISKGIISSALGNKANTKITRKDYVDIFYNALPASAYTVRNTVSSIPDLANNTANAKVYAFYRAGILTGYANTPGKTNGAFGPNDNIKRSEVATILIRMMDSGTRVYFTM